MNDEEKTTKTFARGQTMDDSQASRTASQDAGHPYAPGTVARYEHDQKLHETVITYLREQNAELLDTLKAVLRFHDANGYVMHKTLASTVRAAIAEAEGR